MIGEQQACPTCTLCNLRPAKMGAKTVLGFHRWGKICTYCSKGKYGKAAILTEYKKYKKIYVNVADLFPNIYNN